MTEKELIGALLRGAEFNPQHAAIQELADLEYTLFDALKAKGFSEDQALFMTAKTLEIIFEENRRKTNGD